MRSRTLRFVVWVLAVGVCAVGIWVSGELTREHLAIPRDKDEGKSLLAETCGNLEAWSCEEIKESPYSVFPFGAPADEWRLPTAELGLFYFLAVLSWLIVIGQCTPSRWWAHLILAAGTAVGVGCSVFLELIMWTQLDKPCPLCLATHVASLLLFVFALLLWPRRPKVQPLRAGTPTRPAASEPMFKSSAAESAARVPWPTGRVLLVTPLFAALAMAGTYTCYELQKSKMEVKRLETASDKTVSDYWKARFKYYNDLWQQQFWAWRLASQVNIALEGEPVRGPADARHTVVVYSDFECPACRKFEAFLAKSILPMAAKLGGAKLVFKHWPICTDCNEFAARNLHPLACEAARAAEGARIVGGNDAFWKMHDLLWEHQPAWKKSRSFVEYAREIGLDEQKFTEAMNSDKAMERIQANITEGVNLGKGIVSDERQEVMKVNGTPCVFVDGKRVLTLGRNPKLWTSIFRVPPPAQKPSATRPAGGASPSR